MFQNASKIDKNMPADANAANHVKIRIKNGCFIWCDIAHRAEGVTVDRAVLARDA